MNELAYIGRVYLQFETGVYAISVDRIKGTASPKFCNLPCLAIQHGQCPIGWQERVYKRLKHIEHLVVKIEHLGEVRRSRPKVSHDQNLGGLLFRFCRRRFGWSGRKV